MTTARSVLSVSVFTSMCLLAACNARSFVLDDASTADAVMSSDLAMDVVIDASASDTAARDVTTDRVVVDMRPDTNTATDARPPGPGSTYRVSGRYLYDPCGERVVLRGVNHPTLYVDRPGAAIPEIARTGANAVRIFWFAGHGIPITAAQPVVDRIVANGMVPILEMHDSTCNWNLNPILDYWTSAAGVAFVNANAGNLILNIANEPSAPSAAAYERDYSAAVMRIRAAGIHVPIMIDASRCGRDFETMYGAAPEIVAADPDHSVIFSAHLYDPMTQSQIAALYRRFNDANLAFLVGEFANKSPPGCGAALRYLDIIGEAVPAEVGWLAWSWGDNNPSGAWNGDCAEFDMTRTFAFDTLERWGLEVAVTNANSLTNRSTRTRWMTAHSCSP